MRGSHTYDSKEMSRLIDGTVSEAKELGIETMPLDELKAKTTFSGLTPMTERSILTALQRRHMQILQNH